MEVRPAGRCVYGVAQRGSPFLFRNSHGAIQSAEVPITLPTLYHKFLCELLFDGARLRPSESLEARRPLPNAVDLLRFQMERAGRTPVSLPNASACRARPRAAGRCVRRRR